MSLAKLSLPNLHVDFAQTSSLSHWVVQAWKAVEPFQANLGFVVTEQPEGSDVLQPDFSATVSRRLRARGTTCENICENICENTDKKKQRPGWRGGKHPGRR